MKTDTAVERAARAARQALHSAIGEDYERRRFKFDTDPHGRPTFGRHRDGYLHARIIVDGATRVYFHCRYGSWLAPGDRGVMKEPEALLGTDLGRTVKYTLADEARRFKAREEHEHGRRSDDQADGDAGVRAGEDSQHAPDEVRSD